jgi:hypothetical protein
MKPKVMVEGPAALDNFTRAMRTVFSVPKSAVVESKHKPISRKKTGKG